MLLTCSSLSVRVVRQWHRIRGKHANSFYAQLTTNKQKFNGKELQTTGNTGFLDYGWRFQLTIEKYGNKFGMIFPITQ
ncbi:MAG: hypothetical protein EOM36_00670 [Bacteroidia bacterium]|nr:hypothetical protein [Bacteroidia bacterium]